VRAQRHRKEERERERAATENAIIRALSVSKVTSTRAAGAEREVARGRLWAARVGLIGNFTARR